MHYGVSWAFEKGQTSLRHRATGGSCSGSPSHRIRWPLPESTKVSAAPTSLPVPGRDRLAYPGSPIVGAGRHPPLREVGQLADRRIVVEHAAETDGETLLRPIGRAAEDLPVAILFMGDEQDGMAFADDGLCREDGPILAMRKVIRRGSFKSMNDLRDKLVDFINYFNRVFSHPSRWTYTGRPLVAKRVA
jgi:hypothetical protein